MDRFPGFQLQWSMFGGDDVIGPGCLVTQGLIFWPGGLVESLNWLISLVGLLSTGRAGFVAVCDYSYIIFPCPVVLLVGHVCFRDDVSSFWV